MRAIFVSFAALALAACATTQAAPQLPSSAAIDAEVQRLMAEQQVVGMAVAVIDRGEVVHVNAYGYANVAEQRALQTDTVMYGASLTKTAVAYLVLQLVDEGRIDLDRQLAEYLPKPLPEYEEFAALAGDDRWRLLTARHVLNHATGFHNFRWLEDDQTLRFHFAPGERYAYSGEGFYVLQLVLEEGLGIDVGAEMQRRIFEPFGMTRTSMQWRADFRPNLADGYAMDGSFEPHDERSRVSAPGSMDTTIEDQARMWAAFVNGEGLSASSRAELVRPQLPIRSAHQFPPLWLDTDPRGPEIDLAAGLGLVTFNDPEAGLMFFKGGHNDWTGNMAICQDARRRCVVFLGNSVRAELIYPELARFILGDTAFPWWWEYNR
ncbi:MAG: serine hydrolase domain-containing protein [Terricaulis sp.]